MKFNIANSENIDILYKLNQQLAADEDQAALFIATKEKYTKAFICDNPIVFGILIYDNDTPIGFIIYVNKFATYLASNVLYIEDIYLISNCQTKTNIDEVLQYMVNKSHDESYCRVEMRVFKNYNLDIKTIESNGFKKVEKWDLYRLETVLLK